MLQTPLLKNALTLEGRVTRADQVTSAFGVSNRFGIQFSHSYLDLISLISKLTSQQTQNKFEIRD